MKAWRDEQMLRGKRPELFVTSDEKPATFADDAHRYLRLEKVKQMPCADERARHIRDLFPDAAALIGADYAGVLVRNGWAPYRHFEVADHQTYLAHLARRCHDFIAILAPATAMWPRAWPMCSGPRWPCDRARAGGVSPYRARRRDGPARRSTAPAA